jgi:hypothetical protein
MLGWRRSSRAKARGTPPTGATAAGAPANPFAPLAWPPSPIDAQLVEPEAAPVPDPQPDPAHVAATPAISADAHAQLLRLFEVVTNMCDHVIEYVESDRAERRVMLETLTALGRTITEGAAALTERTASEPVPVETVVVEPPERRERVIGGSMPPGPNPVIDLRPSGAPAADVLPTAGSMATTVMMTEIAVEVRGRFGDRWVDGFEICEVIETPDGHRYRLRRRRDRVILPELFDATSIRHVETFDQLATEGAAGNGSNIAHDAPDVTGNGATGYAGPVTGASNSWSRS